MTASLSTEPAPPVDLPFGRNFLPGPTDVHPDVLAVMTTPMFAHRTERMRQLMERVQPRLQRLFGTEQPVFTVSSSATGLMEAAIRNAVPNRMLAVVGGYFGEMFARLAEACGREVIRAVVPPGRTLEPEQLRVFLDAPDIDAVSLVHSESSTGALAPIETLAPVIRSHSDALVLVDGVTSIGGLPVEMDRWGVDMIFTGSQKAMAIPPGLAFGAASQRLLDRAGQIDDAGFYFNVRKAVDFTREGLPFWTPALSLYLALDRQLERIERTGGAPARWNRHRALAERLFAWADGHPRARLLAGPECRSLTISALELPDERPAAEVARALERMGFLVGTGLDPAHGNLLRIGHMGDLEVAHLDALLAALEPLI